MPEILIDDEKVVFEGTLPDSLGAVLALVERALREGGRVVAHVAVDGVEMPVGGDHALSGIGRIEVTSVTVTEAVARVRAGARQTADEALRALDELAIEVLRVPWDAVRPRCLAVAEKIGASLSSAPGLAAHEPDAQKASALQSAATAVAEALDAWLDHVASGNATAVSLAVDRRLGPALAAFVGRLNEPTTTSP